MLQLDTTSLLSETVYKMAWEKARGQGKPEAGKKEKGNGKRGGPYGLAPLAFLGGVLWQRTAPRTAGLDGVGETCTGRGRDQA